MKNARLRLFVLILAFFIFYDAKELLLKNYKSYELYCPTYRTRRGSRIRIYAVREDDWIVTDLEQVK